MSGTGMFPVGRPHTRPHSAARAVSRFGRSNTQSELVSMAGFLAVQNKPLASLADYEAWLSPILSAMDSRAKTKMDARKLRRIVQMQRNGCSFAEIGRAIGVTGAAISRWLHEHPLPSELAA